MRRISVCVLASVVLAGCDAGIDLTKKEGKAGQLSQFDVNVYPLNNLVCDPFDGNSAPSYNYGLRGRLYYLQPGERYYTVDEYLQYGTRSAQDYFFSQLNVPTRIFSLGFPTETGDVVKNDDGTLLQEFFAFQFSTVIMSGGDQPAGEYELALLSDDGAKLQVRNASGVYEDYVNNDGDHPTRMGCGTRTLSMNSESEHVVNITYYQGPRYHISLIPMWRRVVPGQAAEPLCGQLGNNMYFDPDNGSTVQQAYNQLLSRGWKPIAAENYRLPISAGFNPCVQAAENPQISDVKVENLDGLLDISWVTDKPTTSQILYKVVAASTETMTKSDNILRTTHHVSIPVPQSGDNYLIRAVSISNEYGKVISSPVSYP